MTRHNHMFYIVFPPDTYPGDLSPVVYGNIDAALDHGRLTKGYVYEIDIEDILDNSEFGTIDDDLSYRLDRIN